MPKTWPKGKERADCLHHSTWIAFALSFPCLLFLIVSLKYVTHVYNVFVFQFPSYVSVHLHTSDLPFSLPSAIKVGREVRIKTIA